MCFHLQHLQRMVNCSYPVGKPLFREAPIILSVKQAAASRRGGGKGALQQDPCQ